MNQLTRIAISVAASGLVFFVIRAVVLPFVYHRRHSKRVRLGKLVYAIYETASRLTANADRLMPPCNETKVAYRLVYMEDDIVVINSVAWSYWFDNRIGDVVRQYRLSSEGHVGRRLKGNGKQFRDILWCKGPLTAKRLESLLQVLRSHAPLQSLQSVSERR